MVQYKITKMLEAKQKNGVASSLVNKIRKHSPEKVYIPLIILFVLIAGYFIWHQIKSAYPGNIHVSGRLEGYETNVGAKIGGRVNFIAVREGDLVTPGELIVKISDDDIQAQLSGAAARLHKTQDQEDQSEHQLKIVDSQIEEARLNLSQSTEDTQGRIIEAQENVATARAKLAEAQAQMEQSRDELELARIREVRYHQLVIQGAVTQDQYDQAATNYKSAVATVNARVSSVEAAKKALFSAQGSLKIALTTRFNPSIRTAQLVALNRQKDLTQAQLRAAKMEIANARAAQDEIQANIAYLNIVSPINGIVTARAVEPGAVVVPGQTVLSLIDLSLIYLRGFVPEGQIGKVRVGQQAHVYLDSAPNKPISGKVIEIDPVASFTPENIYFKDDRVKQVFGIKIMLSGPYGFAKPGMPADADIILE